MKKPCISYEGSFAFKTDIGKVRESNEDQALVLLNANNDVLLLVADGMGGSNKGELASEIAAEVIREGFEEKKHSLSKPKNKIWLTMMIKKANKAIFEKSQENDAYQGMGTTLSCCLLVGDTLYLASLGDSRAYLDDGKEIKQLSDDETYANYLFKTGQISIDEAKSHPERHVLTNALGIYPTVAFQIFSLPYNGEKILCCTDGLHNQLDNKTIHAIISTDDRADQKVNILVGTANSAGGNDNVGVAYWEPINA